MKIVVSKIALIKFLKLLKWSKILAKLAAVCATISGAITALSGSATTGVAMGAAGTAGYVAIKGMPGQSCEITTHTPPGRVDRMANLVMQQQKVQLNMFQDRNLNLGMESGHHALRDGLNLPSSFKK